MKIYTLFYKDTNLYNRSVFVMPNDAAAIKAMKLNLMDPRAENFRNEAKLGNTILVSLISFEEYSGVCTKQPFEGHLSEVCNLKELLDDNNGNMEDVKSNNT